MDNYPVKWDTHNYNRPTDNYGRLIGLETFGNSVLEQLWKTIKAEYNLANNECHLINYAFELLFLTNFSLF